MGKSARCKARLEQSKNKDISDYWSGAATDDKPSAECACTLCRGAKEEAHSDKPPFSKGRFGGNVKIE